MSKNYLTYPFKVMRITQSYNGTTSHKPHTTGSPKDYPIDEGCSNGGKEAFYCPCDELKIVKMYGVGTGGTNTIWVESTSDVHCANGKVGIYCSQLTHPDDSDIKKLNLFVGKKFKRGELVCYEGTDGATGNHLHMSCGLGRMNGSGWIKNSKGKWVLTTTEGTYKPEEMFFIDRDFTRVVETKGIVFKNLPSDADDITATRYQVGDYEVACNLLHLRTGPGTEYKKKTFADLSTNAKVQVREKNNGKPADGYVKGVQFTVHAIDGSWGQTPSGWLCLDYCKFLDEIFSSSRYETGNYKVTKASVLNVRTGPGTVYDSKRFDDLTESAQTKIKSILKGGICDGYCKGLTFTVVEVNGLWGRTASGWVCLDYCERI